MRSSSSSPESDRPCVVGGTPSAPEAKATSHVTPEESKAGEDTVTGESKADEDTVTGESAVVVKNWQYRDSSGNIQGHSRQSIYSTGTALIRYTELADKRHANASAANSAAQQTDD